MNNRQRDLFIAMPGDLPWRDDRDAMSLPMVSLGKRKRTRPIVWSSADGKAWVRVSAGEHGLATIWDFDVILWAASQLNDAVEAGRETSPVISFAPYDLLRTIGRGTGGEDYRKLKAALDRLASTYIRTSITRGKRKQEKGFHWLESWDGDEDERTGRPRGMRITVPRWLYVGVVEERAVLAIPPEYFDIRSGLGRWLYRLARRHAGKQDLGWRFSIRHLWERSGSTQAYKDFARDLRRVIERNDLPEYSLEAYSGQKGDPMVAMSRDPGRGNVPQRRELSRLKLPLG